MYEIKKGLKTDVKEFRSYLRRSLEIKEFGTTASTTPEVFDLITECHLCDYYNYHLLEEISDKYLNDNSDIMHSMSEYKNHLEGLKLQTKLSDHIKVMDHSIEEQVHSDSCQYDRSSYSKLEVTLAEEINLNFVDRIWKFIAKHYNLPSLPHALLDRIEAKNLMVTWRVPVLSGLQIQAQCTEGSEKFFQQHKITRVVLNDEPLYGSGLNKVSILTVIIDVIMHTSRKS